MSNQEGMSVAFGAAEHATREMMQTVEQYAEAVELLRAGLVTCSAGGSQDGELSAILGEFTGLLVRVADRTTQAYAATADGMADSVTAVSQADAASAEQLSPGRTAWV
ncbi:hypothetical protein [Nonomuraea sp. NPDC048916]|uniref:hypothetical protein n=1 Tax=Nonomuraea sp. NPDC048916 TaxID=3154232 RepID=UPI00340CC161